MNMTVGNYSFSHSIAISSRRNLDSCEKFGEQKSLKPFKDF